MVGNHWRALSKEATSYAIQRAFMFLCGMQAVGKPEKKQDLLQSYLIMVLGLLDQAVVVDIRKVIILWCSVECV